MFNLSYKKQKYLIIVTFLILPLSLLFTFSLYPALNLFYFSFTDWDGLSPTKDFVWFENYRELFSEPEIFKVFQNHIYYLVGGLIQIAAALYFATVLNSKVRGGNAFKAVLFMPYILNSVAIVLIFKIMYLPEGTLNTFLTVIGLEGWQQSWLGNRSLVNYALAFNSIWRFMGLNLIIFFGVIQAIPNELYEAAKIDGANEWQKFRYITLPSIRTVLNLMLLLAIAGAVEVFEIPFIMTGGANGSSTFVIETVDTAFKFNDYGMASAMAIVLLFMVGIVIFIQQTLFNRQEG